MASRAASRWSRGAVGVDFANEAEQEGALESHPRLGTEFSARSTLSYKLGLCKQPPMHKSQSIHWPRTKLFVQAEGKSTTCRGRSAAARLDFVRCTENIRWPLSQNPDSRASLMQISPKENGGLSLKLRTTLAHQWRQGGPRQNSISTTNVPDGLSEWMRVGRCAWIFPGGIAFWRLVVCK